MADQWRRNGVVALVSKRVVVMGSRRQIDIPGHGVRVALQAEEFPSFRFCNVVGQTRADFFFSRFFLLRLLRFYYVLRFTKSITCHYT